MCLLICSENHRFFAQNAVNCSKYGDINQHVSSHVETIVLFPHKLPDSHINAKIEFGEGGGKVPLDVIVERTKEYQPKPKITYKIIQEFVEKNIDLIFYLCITHLM